jgi:hypothetical protein
MASLPSSVSLPLKQGEAAENELPHVAPEIDQDGKQSAEMRHHIDQDALVGPMHELGNENEVPRGRNGQEFGDALHHGKDDDLLYRHGPLAAPLVRLARRFYTERSTRAIHLILNTWPPTARWRLFCTIPLRVLPFDPARARRMRG